MAKLLKLRRGTTTQHGSFTGAEGEVTVDTTKDTLVVHDGSTQSGHTLLREDMSNLPAGTIDNADVSNSAAIAGTKISPDFGSQDITTTGHITLPDQTSGSGKIKLGTGNDLQIYHNGTRSEIINNTGDLIIQASANNNLLLRAQTGETHFKGQHNGQTELYYDGSRKLHTRADAVNIIGDLDMTDADGYKINLGASSDLQIFHNGTHSIIADVGTGNLQIRAADFRVTNADNTELMIEADTDGPVKLYHNNSLKFQTNISGCRFVGTLAGIDNEKVTLGTSNDLQIYHDGSNSYIYQDGTGELKLNTATFRVMNKNGNETQIYATQNGKVILYYDNNNKLETTSTGIKVLGIPEFRQDSTVTDFTNLSAPGANNSGLYVQNVGGTTGNFAALSAIAHSGNSVGMSASFIAKSHATGYSPEVYITQRDGGNSQRTAIKITNPGAVELNHAGTKKLETTSTGATVSGKLTCTDIDILDTSAPAVRFSGTTDDSNAGLRGFLGLTTAANNFCNGSAAGDVVLVSPEKFIIAHNADEIMAVFNDDGAVQLRYDGSSKFETASTGVTITANNDLRIPGGSWTGDYTSGIKIQPTANDSYFQYHGGLYFRRTNGAAALTLTQTGDLTATGNVTAYSDARLKTNVNTINDALSIVGKLRGVSFDWKETGKPSIGVIAQEVEEVIPEVVLTNVDTDPATGIEKEVKSVDYGKIVGVLINAINELKAEVDELKGGK